MEYLSIDGKKITTKEELHKFVKEQIEKQYNVNLNEITNEDFYRGKKKKQQPPLVHQNVYFKYMYPFKIQLKPGEKQAIFGMILNVHGNPLKNAVIEFQISDYSLGTLTFSPAITFGDGCFFTTFIAGCPGEGCLVMTAMDTSLKREIPIQICESYY